LVGKTLLAGIRQSAKRFSSGVYLYYWRTKSGAEVNFVLHGNGTLIGYETRTIPMQRPKLNRSSRSFIKAYNPDEFYVVNTALKDETMIGQTHVRWLTHLDMIGIYDR